jgi:hypothetical protein
VRWIRVLRLIEGTGMPPIRHEAQINHEHVAKEADVRGVAPHLGLMAPWPARGDHANSGNVRPGRRLGIEARVNL